MFVKNTKMKTKKNFYCNNVQFKKDNICSNQCGLCETFDLLNKVKKTKACYL